MTAPATNRVLAHTGARYPIIQAPMGWIARTQLASAVSRAGGRDHPNERAGPAVWREPAYPLLEG